MTTRGDRLKDQSITQIGGDGVFVKELMSALLDGRADIAVHSMKDLPTELPEQLRCGAVPEREDARDVLLSVENKYHTVEALPKRAVVGTSSLRRAAQLRARRTDLQIRELRGNVDTRVRKLLAGEYDAIVLALAGVKRIGLLETLGGGSPLSVDEMVPAVAQGALYVQCRADDESTRKLIAPLNHPPSALATAMERAFLRRMGGGCLVPIGAHATIDGAGWRLVACVAGTDGTRLLRRSWRGRLEDEAKALADAEALAAEMLDAGAREVIAPFRKMSE